jgi:hypothetical protein
MRIYILSNSLVKKNILPKIEPYLRDIRQVCYIWSLGGLMQVENNKIYRIKIKDVISKKTLLGAYPVTIDESEFIREEECYQIVPRSYKDYSTIKTYHLAHSTLESTLESSLEWVMEYKDDELYDNYFTLPNNEDIHSIKNKTDLLHFLHL